MKVRATFGVFSVDLEAGALPELMSAVSVPITVSAVPASAPVSTGAKRGRKPKGEGAPAAEGGKKRGRPSKAELEARAAAAATGDGDSGGSGDEPDTTAAETPEPDPAPAEAKVEADPAPAKPRGKANGKGNGKTLGELVPPAPDALLKRFTKLVDKDYDKASGLLETFGVDRFSALAGEQHGQFSKALEAAGV